MFDLTRPITLENLEQWVNIVRKGDPNLPILFLGTKHDLEDDIQVDDTYAKEFLAVYNLMDYLKISSKTGENVKNVFDVLTRKILERQVY